MCWTSRQDRPEPGGKCHEGVVFRMRGGSRMLGSYPSADAMLAIAHDAWQSRRPGRTVTVRVRLPSICYRNPSMTRSLCMRVFCVFVLVAPAAVVSAQTAPKRPSVETLERIIASRTPETRIETPDHERITARRIDIVDADGTIR